MCNPTSNTDKPRHRVAYLHLIEHGKSTGKHQALLHGEKVPFEKCFTPVIARRPALDAVEGPVMFRWCPDCLDENARRCEERDVKKQRENMAKRWDRLNEELRSAAQEKDDEWVQEVLEEMSKLEQQETKLTNSAQPAGIED